MDELSMGVIIIDKNENIIFINQTFKNLIGYKDKIFKNLDDCLEILLSNEKIEKEKIKSYYYRNLNESNKNISYQFKTKKNKVRFFNLQISKFEHNKILLELFDITHEVSKKRQIEHRKIIFKNLFSHSLEGILLLDENLNILESNNKIENILEIKKEKIINKNLFKIIEIEKNLSDNEKKEIINCDE